MKQGFFYILLTALLFTTLEPVSKLIADQISPLSMTFLRFLIGSLVLLPFAIAKTRKEHIRLTWQDLGIMALLGILCICVSMLLLQYAVLLAVSPANIAIIFSSNSVFTIVFAAFILKDKITPMKLLAVGLCIAGVLVCTDFSGQTNPMSVVLAVLSALSFSLYTVLSKKFMVKYSGIIQTGFSFFFGSIALLMVLLLMRVDIVSQIDSGNIWHLLYLGIFVSGFGYWTYFQAMHKTSAMAASLVFFIKPILTPFAVFLINGIVPDYKVFLALVLVLAGSYFGAKSPEKRPQ